LTVSQSEPQFSFTNDNTKSGVTATLSDNKLGSSSAHNRQLSPLLEKPAVKVPALSPSQYLKLAFQEWNVTVQPTRDQSCFLQATPERIQAYDRDLLMVIRRQDISELEQLLQNGKLQHNACNAFGESLLHLACRKGMTQVVQFLVKNAKLSCWVHDDYGRTIWHDACWTVRPQWELAEFLMEQAPQLLTMSDVRGHIPLDYVPKSDWGVWLEFLHERRDRLKDLLQAPSKPEDCSDETAKVTSSAARATIAAQESTHVLQQNDDMGTVLQGSEAEEQNSSITPAQGPASAAMANAMEADADATDKIVG
jgi:hypothetical protein